MVEITTEIKATGQHQIVSKMVRITPKTPVIKAIQFQNAIIQ
jgi:hypothetical protein